MKFDPMSECAPLNDILVLSVCSIEAERPGDVGDVSFPSQKS